MTDCPSLSPASTPGGETLRWPTTDPARWVLTATILTTDAQGPLAELHERIPVVLPDEWWDHWLDPHTTGDQGLADAAVDASRPLAASLQFYAVARLPADGNGPELLEPVGEIGQLVWLVAAMKGMPRHRHPRAWPPHLGDPLAPPGGAPRPPRHSHPRDRPARARAAPGGALHPRPRLEGHR